MQWYQFRSPQMTYLNFLDATTTASSRVATCSCLGLWPYVRDVIKYLPVANFDCLAGW